MPPLLKGVFYLLTLSLLAHPMGQALPRRWFSGDRWPWASAPFEREGRFWRKLGVHRWKDKVPDMSRLLGDMVKKQLAPDGKTDYALLVQETCVAECVHCWLVALSVGMLFLWKSVWSWVLWLVYNLLGNVSFILIQRYNRPRLLRLAEKENKKNL